MRIETKFELSISQGFEMHALLLRLNPADWPEWETKITKPEGIWFKTGRRNPSTIHKGLPVVVLATKGGGVVGIGETIGNVVRKEDPDWSEMSDELQDEYRQPLNRVLVKLRRTSVPLEELAKDMSIADLHRRRETTTWLDANQYKSLVALLPPP